MPCISENSIRYIQVLMFINGNSFWSTCVGKSDVTLLTTQIKFLSDEPQDVEFSFNVDSIAQELEETFAITFEISGGRFDESANIRNRLEGVIIDSTGRSHAH